MLQQIKHELTDLSSPWLQRTTAVTNQPSDGGHLRHIELKGTKSEEHYGLNDLQISNSSAR